MSKKELGQYFSGKQLARLLTKLTKLEDVISVIDPMCGIGDMFYEFRSLEGLSSYLTGIEIDSSVYDNLQASYGGLCNVKLFNGNAFSMEIINQLNPNGYDLVITNPPYVRLQSLNRAKEKNSSILGLNEIRENLIESLSLFKTLDQTDKDLFKNIISFFSGRSDLAVPSWILCAILVKEGGKIAMVVPETWLNREYALIIKYLLLRWFKIEYIIEDANSKWFSTAQVKTTLIVAKRIKRKNSFRSWRNENFIFASLYAKSISENSLVGNIFPLSSSPELQFIDAIDNEKSIKNLFESRSVLLKDFACDLNQFFTDKQWYSLLEKEYDNVSDIRIKSFSPIKNWCSGSKASFLNLENLGISVGQGLRTGANDFFYMNYRVLNNKEIMVLPQKKIDIEPFIINKKYFKKVIRRQSELNDSFGTKNNNSDSIVLYLQSFALDEDISNIIQLNTNFGNIYREIPEPLANYVRAGATYSQTDKLIPELSAVKTNIREWNPNKKDKIPRFWYSLPVFKRRHFPDLFVPRVNSERTRTRLNIDSEFIIDANFLSIWISNINSSHNNFSLLALLNSTWAVISMEEYGTKMGGGALKLDAVQLKKIPFPIIESSQIEKLTKLGRELSICTDNYDKIVFEIDNVVVNSMGFKENILHKLNELFLLKKHYLNKRTKK